MDVVFPLSLSSTMLGLGGGMPLFGVLILVKAFLVSFSSWLLLDSFTARV